MRLSEFNKPAPPVSESVPTHEPPASEAPQEEQNIEYFTSVTPSGIEVAYSPAPRRHYKLRQRHMDCDPEQEWQEEWLEVPSVTNVLGVLDKSGPLVWWAQRIGIEGMSWLQSAGKLGLNGDSFINFDTGKYVDSDGIVAMLTEYQKSVNHQRDKAADRGVNVHDALETWVKTRDIPEFTLWPENERGYVEGLAEFLGLFDEFNVTDVDAELMVGSLQHSYAGRFDLVLTLSKAVEVVTKVYPKRKPKVEEIPAGRYLLDLKTSKGIYNTHYLQLEAYEAAAVECGYEPTDHRGVIHVTTDGRYELALNKDWTLDDFLAVRRCYQVMNERGVVQALRDELDAKEVAC